MSDTLCIMYPGTPKWRRFSHDSILLKALDAFANVTINGEGSTSWVKIYPRLKYYPQRGEWPEYFCSSVSDPLCIMYPGTPKWRRFPHDSIPLKALNAFPNVTINQGVFLCIFRRHRHQEVRSCTHFWTGNYFLQENKKFL